MTTIYVNFWIDLFICLTVFPYGDVALVHIGLSDTPHTTVDASIVSQFSNCTSMVDPNPSETKDLESSCQSRASGRYVYVYVEQSEALDISEFRVYGSPVEEPRTCM